MYDEKCQYSGGKAAPWQTGWIMIESDGMIVLFTVFLVNTQNTAKQIRPNAQRSTAGMVSYY